jgi:uncharacterized membrane protein
VQRAARIGLWVLGLGAWLWVLAILVAPVAADSSHDAASFCVAAVYAAGSNVCHQRPERAFHIAGHKMPVCARCTGLYVSAAAGFSIALILAAPMTARRARLVLLIAAVPTALTWGLEYAGVMAFGNVARALAAVPLGCAAGWLIVTQCRIERSNE